MPRGQLAEPLVGWLMRKRTNALPSDEPTSFLHCDVVIRGWYFRSVLLLPMRRGLFVYAKPVRDHDTASGCLRLDAWFSHDPDDSRPRIRDVQCRTARFRCLLSVKAGNAAAGCPVSGSLDDTPLCSYVCILGGRLASLKHHEAIEGWRI
jgi:hypothetical protein